MFKLIGFVIVLILVGIFASVYMRIISGKWRGRRK